MMKRMKKLITVFVFLISCTNCFAQNKGWVDSVAANYDLLKNKPFAELLLEDTSGKIFNTSSLSGKTIYVDFWFTACAPCLKEIPYSKALHQSFAHDTNVVFLSICIENINRKPVWKQMIKEKEMPGIHLFYARNRPQKINLLRAYNVQFPTYLLVNKEMKVIGYDAPRPSSGEWVHWAIEQATKNVSLADFFRMSMKDPKAVRSFIQRN
jgi:thiol-disulfide isomerase/thioredoxin